MGRHSYRSSRFDEALRDRASQRGPRLGIGGASQLVEQHQYAFPCLFEDAAQRHEVCRERRKASRRRFGTVSPLLAPSWLTAVLRITA